MRAVGRAWLMAAIALAVFFPLVASAQSCVFQCRSSGGCEIRSLNGQALDQVPESKIWPASRQCFAFVVAAGNLKGMMAVAGGRPQELDLAAGKSFEPAASKKTNGCELYSAGCKESLDKRATARTGGKNFDNFQGFAALGEPCKVGLPCGRLLPRREPLKVTINDQGAQGRIEIVGLRGSQLKLELPVADGAFEIAGDVLAPGSNYTYQIKGPQGDVQYAGRFSIVSTKEESEFLADLNKPSAFSDVPLVHAVSVLAEHELGWEIQQLVQTQSHRSTK